MSDDQKTTYFSPEFKQEAASQVLDQGYSYPKLVPHWVSVKAPLPRRVHQLADERQGITPKGKALTPEQQRIQELEARCKRHEIEKLSSKSYRSLDVGRNESYALRDQLSEQIPVAMVCNAFDIRRSSYYENHQQRHRVDVERLAL